MIFDTHAHYDAAQFDQDRDQVLASLKEAGVMKVCNISNGWKDLLATLDLVDRIPWFYGAVGIHPCEIRDLTEERLEEIRTFAHRDRIVAIGEIGLDYYWVKDKEERINQGEWFVRQLHLAREEDLPVVIHSRDAAQDTFDIMKKEHAGSDGGIIHCYSGSVEMAREYVKLGYMIGVGGVVTFKNGRVLKEVVAEIPLDHIVVETDCPYLAPVPYRGKRNSSQYLPYIIDQIALIKGLDPQEVEETTWDNAMRVYRMDQEAQ